MDLVIQFMATALLTAALLAIASKLLPNRLSKSRTALIALGFAAIPLLRFLFEWDSLPHNLLAMSGFAILPFVVFYFFQGTIRQRLFTLICFFLIIGVSDSLLTIWLYYRFSPLMWWEMTFGETGIFSILRPAILLTSYVLFGAGYFFRPILWLIGMFFALLVTLPLGIYTAFKDRKLAHEKELEEIRHHIELEKAHYLEIERRRDELAKLRHDFNNQLATIARLVRSGEDVNAQAMISTLADEIRRTQEYTYCSIPVVDAMLSEKAEECKTAEVGLEVSLDIPVQLSVEQTHLCSIFGNLLDNALTACKKLVNRENLVIRLSSMIDGDYLFIRIINPSDAPGEKPAKGRGYGTRILSGIAARYEGEYLYEYSEGVFSATVSLMTAE